MGQGMRVQAHLPVHTAPEFCSLLSWRFTSTETIRLIGDGGRMGQGMRVQARLPVHTVPELSTQSSSFLVLYVHRNNKAYQGRWKNERANVSPGPSPCSHSTNGHK